MKFKKFPCLKQQVGHEAKESATVARRAILTERKPLRPLQGSSLGTSPTAEGKLFLTSTTALTQGLETQNPLMCAPFSFPVSCLSTNHKMMHITDN
jgi:hypothetical protein